MIRATTLLRKYQLHVKRGSFPSLDRSYESREVVTNKDEGRNQAMNTYPIVPSPPVGAFGETKREEHAVQRRLGKQQTGKTDLDN